MKPLWQLPPSEAKSLLFSTKNIKKQTKNRNVALQLPKYPLLRDILGDLRATFLADLARKLFFYVIVFLGACGSQGLYNSSRKNPFSRDSLESREFNQFSRDSREHPFPECGKQRRIQPFCQDSRELRGYVEIPLLKRPLSYFSPPFSGHDSKILATVGCTRITHTLRFWGNEFPL